MSEKEKLEYEEVQTNILSKIFSYSLSHRKRVKILSHPKILKKKLLMLLNMKQTTTLLWRQVDRSYFPARHLGMWTLNCMLQALQHSSTHQLLCRENWVPIWVMTNPKTQRVMERRTTGENGLKRQKSPLDNSCVDAVSSCEQLNQSCPSEGQEYWYRIVKQKGWAWVTNLLHSILSSYRTPSHS